MSVTTMTATAWRGIAPSLPRLVPPPAWAHAGRTTLAALAALGIAYSLELNNPYSAAVTVLIVANPVHGMVLAKSVSRFVGTLAGALMAILLMGLFSQIPELFMLGLSLWMGLCTLGSTLLRNFRSYGTVLAGYTVVLIAMPGTDAPQTMFDLVTTRVSVVFIGIACSGIVAALLTSRSAVRGLDVGLRGAMRNIDNYVRLALNGSDGMRPLRRKLSDDVSKLDALVEFAATESAEVAPLRDTLRTALAAMLGVLTAAASLRDVLRRERPDGALARLIADSRDLLSEIDAGLDIAEPRAAAERLTTIHHRLFSLGTRVAAGLDPTRLRSLVVHDRLAELLDELRVALTGMIALQAGRPIDLAGDAAGSISHARRLAFHLDWRAGLINGARAMLAVWFAGAIWILSGWPYGWMMLVMVVPNAGLLALRDHPERDAVEFIKGCTAAAAMGWICLVYLLPMTDSFAGLCLVLGPCLFLAVMLANRAKTAFIGLGISVFFLTMLSPTNPMVYDASLYLNGALAMIGGAVLTMVVFRVILPSNPRGHVRAMVRTIRRDIEALLGNRRDITPSGWEARMHDRMLQMISRMRVADMRHEFLMRGGFASLRIGREIIRARRLLADFADDTLVTAAMAPSRQALGDLAKAPVAAVHALRGSADKLLALAVTERTGIAADLARAAASLLEIALLVGQNRRFFEAGRD
jgi:uncharacterized membrane protein YccC